MCGIIYIKRTDNKPSIKPLLKRYQNQKSRGSSGFGYVALENGIIKSYNRTKTENTIIESMQKNQTPEILFHHRFPTSTPNLAETAHPIEVNSPLLKYRYYVTHNGIISNASELKKQHEKMGFSYSTELWEKMIMKQGVVYSANYFNDSEALAIDFALTLEKKQPQMLSKGDIALIALKTTKKNQKAVNLYYARNEGNPLISFRDKNFWCISSEGQGQKIKPHQLHTYNYAKDKITETPMQIGKATTNKEYISYLEDDLYDDYPLSNNQKLNDKLETLYEELEEEKEKLAQAQDANNYEAEMSSEGICQIIQDEILELEYELEIAEYGFSQRSPSRHINSLNHNGQTLPI